MQGVPKKIIVIIPAIFYSEIYYMCIQTVLQVKKIYGNKAIMKDGREVVLGSITHIAPGDYLSVYANVVLDKVISKKKGKRV